MTPPTLKQIIEKATPGEQWLPVVGMEGLYEVSSMGRVRSLLFRNRVCIKSRIKIIKPTLTKKGYHRVCLRRVGEKRQVYVHTLVIEAFVGPKPEGKECAHQNGIKTDNTPGNLIWKTHKENQHDQFRHGTFAVGSRNGNSSMTEADAKKVIQLRDSGMEYQEISKLIPISATNACAIVKGRAWSRALNLLNGKAP